MFKPAKSSGLVHWNVEREDDTKSGSNRSFGFVFMVVFLIVGVWPAWYEGPVREWALWVAFIFGAVSLIIPAVLTPLNRLWFFFGLLLHKIVNPLVMGVLFFGVVMPMGVIMRLFGKEFLFLTFNKKAKSYWLKRDDPFDPDRFNQQF
jgi:hypothetical protein